MTEIPHGGSGTPATSSHGHGKPPVRKPAPRPVPVGSQGSSNPVPAGAAPAGQFDFAPASSNRSAVARLHRKRSGINPGLVIGGIVGALLVVSAIVFYQMSETGLSLAIKAIPLQEVEEMSALRVDVSVENADLASGALAYSLPKAPDGAQIDPETGQITWTPTEEQGPGEYKVVVRVETGDEKPQHAQREFVVQVHEKNQAPEIEPIAEQTVRRGASLKLTVVGRDPDVPPRNLQYRLVEGEDAGAKIDPRTGEFTWTAAEARPGGVQRFVVQVEEVHRDLTSAQAEFSVRVEGRATPTEQLVADLRVRGLEVQPAEGSLPGPLAAECQLLSVDGEQIGVYEYGEPAAAEADARVVTTVVMERLTKSAGAAGPGRLYQSGRLLVLYLGGKPGVNEYLDACCGGAVPLAAVTPATVPDEPPTEPTEPGTKPEAAPEDQFDARVLALHEEGKLFSMKEYPTLRKIFADRFESSRAEELRQAFGEDREAMMQWFGGHVDIKEELFTAIDPEKDNVLQALTIFRDLWKQFPDKIEPFAEAAIAVAIVWDMGGRGVYDYGGHQRRCKSTLPEEPMLGAAESFQYLITADRTTQAYAQFLPWEFLKHVVNHKTPARERQWAASTYAARRMRFGKCYHDVPYDNKMLETGSKEAALNDKQYTLPNIRQYGGVCAMQADFAARVGKSMGIPAEYVGGASSFGEGHAWVMWVELKAVPSKAGISFTLESHGRYRGDHYYVGHLTDPHTGERITDRQMELRLQTVGMNSEAKRHAERVMAVYPMIRERMDLPIPEQIIFLNKVIELCPGNESAWRTLAAMSRDGVLTKEHNKAMQAILRKVFTVFARAPDFTWEIFDDLVAYMDIPKQRNKLYGELIALYVNAKRPDLACEAILKYTDYLVEDKQDEEAIGVLQNTILAFAHEGRYVPRMLDKMEQIYGDTEGAPRAIAMFYQQLLPQIPEKRGDRASPYCLQMYERGIQRLAAAGFAPQAAALKARLDRLQGGKK